MNEIIKWTIYCHIHIESGRRYVGLTKLTMMKRWNRHVYNAFYSKKTNGKTYKTSHFVNAIRKYGKDSFSHYTLEVCSSLEDANFMEDKWIELLETRNPRFGFNIEKGGTHIPHPIRNPWDRPEFRDKVSTAIKKRSQDPIIQMKHSIASKYMWQDPEYRVKISASKAKSQSKNPEFRAKISAIVKARSQDPEFRAKMSTVSKVKLQDPEFRAKNLALLKIRSQDPECKSKISSTLKARWQDPEFRAKMSIIAKAKWQDPEFRAKMSPKMSIIAKAKWQDPEFRAKKIDSK